MRELLIIVAAIFLAGCGESGGSVVDEPAVSVPPGPSGMSRYSTSQPLIDNSDACAYRILVMGNSHAAELRPVLERLLMLGQPDKSIDSRSLTGSGFLSDKVNDGVSEQTLESEAWTHVILQGQKYSTTGSTTYPTYAAEYWVRGSKEQGATPIMFPEHPREDNSWEGQTLWELHSGIAARENTCVAPVGLVWDEVIFQDPSLILHIDDGNHASGKGLLLNALIFYPIITGQPIESLPELSEFGVDANTEQIMREAVSSLLFTYPPCFFEA
jgi:hypothetical protein